MALSCNDELPLFSLQKILVVNRPRIDIFRQLSINEESELRCLQIKSGQFVVHFPYVKKTIDSFRFKYVTFCQKIMRQ